jgi:hypothetical protein
LGLEPKEPGIWEEHVWMKSPHEKGKKKKVEKGEETGSKKSQKWPSERMGYREVPVP